MTIKMWGTYESPEVKILKEKFPLMDKMDEDYPDFSDDVDESNYDPYAGCDVYDCEPIDDWY